MGALATLLARDGHEVRGSDTAIYPPMSTQLAREGIPVALGFGPQNLDWNPDCVVVGNVCRKDHPEVLAAQDKGIALTSFPKILSERLLASRTPLVVTGTHGKTTTTSVLAWLLKDSGQDPSWLIGGVPLNGHRSSALGQGPAFVLEGDEYDTAFFDKESKFLHYRPKRAIFTSLEFDHADIFDSLDEIRAAFRKFIALIPEDGDLVAFADDPEVMGLAQACKGRVHTYKVIGEQEEPDCATYCARVLSRPAQRRTEFEWFERGVSCGIASTHLTGQYNIANALSALAIARCEGVDAAQLNRALGRYRGVARRQELVGIARGVRVIDDFAHHPTAVALTVQAARRRHPRQTLHVCFEPRSASSRRDLFSEGYATAFEGADRVYIGPLHAPEKIPPAERLDPVALAQKIRDNGVQAQAYQDSDEIVTTLLEQAGPGDTILVLSSGHFGGLVKKVLVGLGDAVTRANPDDRSNIDALLHQYGLPQIRDPDGVESLVIAGPDGQMVGCVNLELRQDICFFFGLAVAQERRGEGLGWMLADLGLRRARAIGARWVYLITNDAADFFATRGGFTLVPLSEIPQALQESSNFQATRSESMHGMRCDLTKLS